LGVANPIKGSDGFQPQGADVLVLKVRAQAKISFTCSTWYLGMTILVKPIN